MFNICLANDKHLLGEDAPLEKKTNFWEKTCNKFAAVFIKHFFIIYNIQEILINNNINFLNYVIISKKDIILDNL